MILTELDPFRGTEADVALRLQADRMAYYLRRHYRRSREVDVLNGLRVRSGNSIASIDHLLLHDHGLLLIAREMVTGCVEINREGHWHRHQDGAAQDMGAPITRAYVQGLLLKAFLDRRVQQRGFFDRLELDVLVVLPDEVDITWPGTGPLAEVCRRDDAFDRVSLRLAQCQQAARGPGLLTESERRVLGNFLCKSHQPAA